MMYIVCKIMDIHGYSDIQWVWIWSDIHAHGYFHGRGKMRLMDLDLDLVLQYPSKPAPLPSLYGKSSEEIHLWIKTSLQAVVFKIS
jgi:hypothetical protein